MSAAVVALAPTRRGEGYKYIIDEDRLILVTSEDGLSLAITALDCEPDARDRASQWAGQWVGTTDAGLDIYVYDRLLEAAATA
jgi:hypothetical protein